MKLHAFRLPLSVFIFISVFLSAIQVNLPHPMLIAERFIKGGGWLEIIVIATYGAVVAYKMQNPVNVPYWRKVTWTLFSIVFFGQLILGLLGFEKFLMTGKLHLPIPMMILGGPVYRGQLSVMTILFLSTIVLTGPAWCSQFCYFGAMDNLASGSKPKKEKLPNRLAIKTTGILLVIAVTILLRWFNVPVLIATIIAAGFGIGGVIIMVLFSRKQGKMIHCLLYCPIGTLVNVLKPANPFRLYIDNNCTFCMKCTSNCKYDALNQDDIRKKKPDTTCTLCGDCLAGCHHNAIKYKYFSLKPETARRLYLFLTISIHAIFLALARI